MAKQNSKTDKEIVMAVIAMSLHQMRNEAHDIESGVITIKPKQTAWNSKRL